MGNGSVNRPCVWCLASVLLRYTRSTHRQKWLTGLRVPFTLPPPTRAHTHTQRNPLAPRPAVQDVVEAAVRALVGEGNASPCQVSSRTDAGVHALRNVLHVDMCRRARQDVGAEPLEPHPPEVVRRALNARLRGTQVGG